MNFSELKLHPHLLKNVEALGFETPTPVQAQAIPYVLDGHDVMACAQTGTGKTAAFTLPVANLLMSTEPGKKRHAPRAVVLTPTRELADQVMNSVQDFIKGTPLKTGLVVGGVSYQPQIKMLQRPLDILVATPGRLIDHMEAGRVDLSQVHILILDEADRMLDMGFVAPVENILSKMTKKRQTLLFSATFDRDVQKLAQRFLKDPVEIKLATTTQNHDSIVQSLFHVTDKEHKRDLLKNILADRNVWQAIIFMKTKHATEKLAKQINGWGHEAAALNGDMKQNKRKKVIEQMHKNKLKVLVATDVAARGLDVKELSHVVNFDLPQMSEDYIHRIGRTGRAGAEGTAISFVSSEERHLLGRIEKLLGRRILSENDEPRSRSKTATGQPKKKFHKKKAAAAEERMEKGPKKHKKKFAKKPEGAFDRSNGKSNDRFSDRANDKRSADRRSAESYSDKPKRIKKPDTRQKTTTGSDAVKPFTKKDFKGKKKPFKKGSGKPANSNNAARPKRYKSKSETNR